MPESAFITYDELFEGMPPEKRRRIEAEAEAIALASAAANLKGLSVRQFAHQLHAMGAHLVAKLPNGKEIDLPLPGVHS